MQICSSWNWKAVVMMHAFNFLDLHTSSDTQDASKPSNSSHVDLYFYFTRWWTQIQVWILYSVCSFWCPDFDSFSFERKLFKRFMLLSVKIIILRERERERESQQQEKDSANLWVLIWMASVTFKSMIVTLCDVFLLFFICVSCDAAVIHCIADSWLS